MPHTPGPWRVEPYILRGSVDGENDPGDVAYEVVADREDYSGPRNIVSTNLQPGDDDTGWLAEDEANARLIAAAPDLLAALEDALGGWRYIRRVHGDLYGVGWNRVEDAARAAIAKATGKEGA